MKLSISNIAWAKENDGKAYALMKKYGYSGLEIAPTRIFPENPYDDLESARKWSEELKKEYDFSIPSMQSIWYGRQEKIFGTNEERSVLSEYTKKAIDFAAAIGCGNLVFGCPRNRNLPEGLDEGIAISFFKNLGEYAISKGTVIGMEANPPIYNTNYINDTQAALELIKKVDSKGFLLNLDVGTMIQNEEEVEELEGNVQYINHVHISEPGLKLIEERELHKNLYEILKEESYTGFVSIEMGRREELEDIDTRLEYIRRVFANE